MTVEVASPWARTLALVVSHHSGAWAGTLAQTLRGAGGVVIVDNASEDGSADTLAAALPEAELVRLGTNIGFGAAHNLAARRGFARWPSLDRLLLLNPDCQLDERSLEALHRLLDAQPRAGAVSPQLLHADGSPQRTHRDAFFKSGRPPALATGAGPAEWVSGACLLVRRAAWDEVGGFDPRYFLFYEDDDLCLRLQRAGWQCFIEPAATASHAMGTGSSFSWARLARRHFHLARSKRRAIATWVGGFAALRYRLTLVLGALVATPLYMLLLQPRHALKWAAWGASAFVSIDRPWASLPADPGPAPKTALLPP